LEGWQEVRELVRRRCATPFEVTPSEEAFHSKESLLRISISADCDFERRRAHANDLDSVAHYRFGSYRNETAKTTPSVSVFTSAAAVAEFLRRIREFSVRDLFAQDPNRRERTILVLVGPYLDYSKSRINDDTVELLMALAKQAASRSQIAAMLRGHRINITVNRSVRAFHGRVVRHDAKGSDNCLVVQASNQRDEKRGDDRT
jgi:hypothetical protein